MGEERVTKAPSTLKADAMLRPTNLVRSLIAYGASEVAAKASRLLVVVAVSRTLDAEAIGLAAAALAAGEILKSLTETGVNQRVIAAAAEDLPSVCRTARWVFWVWCVGLFLLQAAIAGAIWLGGGEAALAALLLTLGAEYLFMPGGLVQAALAMREGKMSRCAAIAGGQVVGANLLSAALSAVWPSSFALVLPRLLAAPIWLVAMRRLRPWRVDRTARPAPLRPFVAFGWAVLGVELFKALRLQADKLVVGMLLGAELLGQYFMAFNAGLGLASSFAAAFSTVLYPYLCASSDRALALRSSILTALCFITPAVAAQALLAPWYVPILLGDEWSAISGVVATLCLVAIPATLWSAAAGWLRAEGRPEVELAVTAALAGALTLNSALFAPSGLEAIAAGYLVLSILIMGGASLPALRAAFHRRIARI